MAACLKCGQPTFGVLCAACADREARRAPVVEARGRELLEAGDGMIYVLEDRVALEVSDVRIEFPPNVAETVARGLLRGVAAIRAGKAKHGDKIL